MSNPITPEQRAACAKALEELHEGQRDVYEFAKDDACWWLAAYEARVIRLEAELEKSDRQVSELSSRMVTNVRRESRREVLRSLLRAERAASVDHNAPSRESVLIDRALAAEARVAELEDQIRTSKVEACVLRSGLAEEIKRSAEYNRRISLEREHERAAVVAWLRGRTGQPCDQHLDFADDIEAGAHLPGGRDE